jgi:hypothetical protein
MGTPHVCVAESTNSFRIRYAEVLPRNADDFDLPDDHTSPLNCDLPSASASSGTLSKGFVILPYRETSLACAGLQMPAQITLDLH